MCKIYIYGLISSELPLEIKYIGKSKQKLTKRVHDHIRESYKLKTKKDVWIQLVINKNCRVLYKKIEQVTEHNWAERERYWISNIKNLTNVSKGGDGGRGLIYNKSYDELKLFIKENMKNVHNSIDWIKFVNNNPNFAFLPKYPYASYKNRGWISWSDFLYDYNGNPSQRRNAFKNLFKYHECKEFIKKYNIKSVKEWRKSIKILDIRIPSAPDYYYSKTNEWESWGNFLGTKNTYTKNFLTYKSAKEMFINLKLNSHKDYIRYIKYNNLENILPYNPHAIYSKTNEWENWYIFLHKN